MVLLWRQAATATGLPQHRQKHQRHGQRCQQTEYDRGGQVFHEFTDDAGPEQQRQKHHDGSRNGCDHRPGHAAGGPGPGFGGCHPLLTVAIRQLRHHDGAVHQHPRHQYQREQHDNIEGKTQHVDQQDTGEEGTGNGQPHQQRGTQPQCRQHHDQYKHHCRQHVVEQVGEQLLHLFRLVHHVVHLHPLGQQRTRLLDQRLDLIDGIDDVGTGTLGHFQYHPGLAVDAGKAVRILEGAAQQGHIGEGDDPVAIHLHRHVEHIIEIFDHAGHFQRQSTGACVQTARRHQPIVVADQLIERSVIDLIAVQYLRIDNDLQQVLAVATDIHFQHIGDALQFLLQPPCRSHQFGLADRPIERNRHHRKQRYIDLVDAGFIRFGGQFGAGGIHLFTHVCQRGLGVKTGIKLQHHRRMAFRGDGGHLLYPFE